MGLTENEDEASRMMKILKKGIALVKSHKTIHLKYMHMTVGNFYLKK